MAATIEATGAAQAHVRLVEPLAGFAGLDEFTLTPIDAGGVLYSLRSVEDPALRFVLTPAGAFFPDYAPEIPERLGDLLGADSADLFVMVAVGNGLVDATANLRAPLVVGHDSGTAVQVVLEDESLPMNAPLVPPGRPGAGSGQ